METLTRTKYLTRGALALARHPGAIPMVLLYWCMTRDMPKRTAANREHARVLFASRILGINEGAALSAAEAHHAEAHHQG